MKKVLKTITVIYLCSIWTNLIYAQSQPIANQWIVMLNESSLEQSGETVKQMAVRLVNEVDLTTQTSTPGKINDIYSKAIKGFKVTWDEESIKYLGLRSEVKLIENDSIEILNEAGGTQSPSPSWGLDRIDQAQLPLDDSYTYQTTGLGVHAYIIDSGIRINHDEFVGRIGEGYDFIDDDNYPDDCDGHGTNVAGVLGGSTYGVSKDVILHPLKVANCSGGVIRSYIISSLEWIIENHESPAIINISLGSGFSSIYAASLQNTLDNGIAIFAAAGNQDFDACQFLPPAVSGVFTSSGSDKQDRRVSYIDISTTPWTSNKFAYGACVDIFSPGRLLKTAGHESDSDVRSVSGTSFASPMSAGAAALYLQTNPSATVSEISDFLIENAVKDKLTDIGQDSPNLLLNIEAIRFDIPELTGSPILGDYIDPVAPNWLIYRSTGANHIYGYNFEPSENGHITALGAHVNGEVTVQLFNRTTGERLARATVNSQISGAVGQDFLPYHSYTINYDPQDWTYSSIEPVRVNKGTTYTVAVYPQGANTARRRIVYPTEINGIKILGYTFALNYISRDNNDYGLEIRPTNNINFVKLMQGQADIMFEADEAGDN